MERSEQQPPFPRLYGCRATGSDYCSRTGCFYENLKAKVMAREDLPLELKEEHLEKLDTEARELGCKKST